MSISATKFVIIFLVSAFAFIIVTNLLLQPVNGDWFPGTGSPIAWKRTLATILYPVKIVLAGPMVPLLNLPDPPPPFLVIAFALYWTILALVIHYLIGIIKRSQLKT